MLYRVFWKITGEVSRLLVEDVEDRWDAVFLPLTGWVLTAALVTGGLSMTSVPGSVLIVFGVASGYLASLFTLAGGWYLTHLDSDHSEVSV